MSIEKPVVYLEIENCFKKLFEQMQSICAETEKEMFVSKTTNLPRESAPYLQYIIELYVRKNVNTDDEGVALSIDIGNVFSDIGIRLDVIRSFGEMLFYEEYLLKIGVDVKYKQEELNKIIERIKELPEMLFSFAKK